MPEVVDLPERCYEARRRRMAPNFDDGEGLPSLVYRNFGQQRRITVDIHQPQIDNYRSLSVASISGSGLPQPYVLELIGLLPEKVSYSQYVELEGWVSSPYQYPLVRQQVQRLFYPWWQLWLMNVIDSIIQFFR